MYVNPAGILWSALNSLQYPYLILVNSLIPALLAGNSVILKPSPQTPTIVEHIASIFIESGLPQNVIQFFHAGSPSTIETIVRNPNISLICFTGSVAGGLAVQKAAADRIVNVGLELGGKDPAYIRADVNVAWAAEEIVDGAVFNSGQSCCSLERVYVDAKIHDEFIEALQGVLANYKLGDPFDTSTHLGPVISKRSKDTIESHIKDALEKGARDVTPQTESFQSPPPDGNFVKPTLLVDVNHGMRVMTEETFGPIIPVMKVKDDDEAISMMNDSEFGLTASIWTKDTKKGAELAESVNAGTVFVNRCDFPSPVSDSLGVAYTSLIRATGSGVDGVEEFRKRRNAEQVWVRTIREVEEFPRQGLSKIGCACPPFLGAESYGEPEFSAL